MIQNKHIIRLSFIGLFINIIANIVLYRYFMIEEVVFKQASGQNIHIAKTYSKSIWNKNRNGVTKFTNHNYKQLLQDEDFIDFSIKSIDFLQDFTEIINIYDNKGNKIFTNTDDQIIETKKSNDAYSDINIIQYFDHYFLSDYVSITALEDAFSGKTSHSLNANITVHKADTTKYRKSFITTYMPIITSPSQGSKIEGVIEITRDISEQWKNIAHLEKRIFVSFIIVFFVFFIIVMYNTNYAQKIINKQFETNRALKEAINRAEAESSAKTEFLANTSHELRTPLNAIIGFSEIIISETYGKLENKQYKDYIADINISGKHLLSIINDILDLSKASANKLRIDKVELDLNKLASSSLRLVKPRADSASVKLIEDFPKDHIIIYADPKRLKQALLNLLSNSVKFTPSNGSVSLSIKTNSDKKTVSVIVKDTGIGMSEKEIPKALASFGQVDNKLSRKYEGTGLGLPLTKKLVELMKGKMILKSQTGKGTTVTITFKYKERIGL